MKTHAQMVRCCIFEMQKHWRQSTKDKSKICMKIGPIAKAIISFYSRAPWSIGFFNLKIVFLARSRAQHEMKEKRFTHRPNVLGPIRQNFLRPYTSYNCKLQPQKFVKYLHCINIVYLSFCAIFARFALFNLFRQLL